MTINSIILDVALFSYSSTNDAIMIGWGIGILVWGIIWGCITKAVSSSKGYDGGFAWGFFLGLIGLIVVACKPNVKTLTNIIQAPQQTSADELMKYKELLDQGAITQREFDAKKRQLLNLDQQPQRTYTNPAPRKMGNGEWYCKKCYTKNAAYSMICTKCGASRAEQAAKTGYRDTKY